MDVKGPRIPSLAVLQGEGHLRQDHKPILRTVVLARPAPQQLELFGEAFSLPKIISVGLDGIDFDLFEEIIKTENIKHIIDIRLSPSFLGRGFSLEVLRSLIQREGVNYEHAPVFANKYVGESWDQAKVMHKYAEYIWTQKDALAQLKEKASAGPLLLLGRATHHCVSGRSILTNALTELGLWFSLRAIDNFEDTGQTLPCKDWGSLSEGSRRNG
ncbi:DUF488 domain-containing protein [Corallococcus sp. CA053C]|uniref:DUF488 domain-containing protein n=1 Tax=Corallococcus sp. CA053C TaxID=2316732 RepID=UPI000EA3C4A2|nr:DUF488 domain-containing protein [Corallococcus sp. CA053C]RKH15338.1 DUF488 domain-containing protein [Corallococcus sp. CA053C]